MKKFLKKTLTAGMLALMTCTSMSAMAASEWVWTSQELRGAGKTFDEICEAVVASRAHTAGPWKVEYLGSWYLVSDRTVYCRAINEFDNQNFVAGGFVCDKGKFFFNDPDRPDGCYEFKELNIPRNNDWCEIRDIDRDKYKGAVACDEMNYDYSNISDIAQREYYPCVWNDAVKNDTAKSIVAYCTKLHEDLHIQQARSGNYSQYGQPTCRAAGWLGFEAPDNSNERYGYHNAEHEAFALDSRCLQGSLGLCGDDQACRDEIERHINHTKTDSERHQQCAGFSSNKSQEYSDAGCNKI